MEKSTPLRLIEAGFETLASLGGAGFALRKVEDAAGLPHGSIRHHFGGRDGFLSALVDALLDADETAATPDLASAGRRMLGPQRRHTIARYELTLMALREPVLRAKLVRGRERLVDLAASQGLERSAASALVASFDGVLLDALLRERTSVDAAAAALAPRP